MSKRIDNIEFSPMHKYYEIAKKLEEDNIKVFNLSSAQPDFNTDISYYNALKGIVEGRNAYGNCRGLRELRIEFAKYYNEKIKKNKYQRKDIQITLGASDAIISLLMAICNDEDTIIIVEPFFCDYKNYCKMLNINIIYVTLEDLKRRIVIPQKTKAILFSNPNNPSGNILDYNEMNVILEIAKENDLYIISDEVYNELIYDNNFMSFASYDYEKIIVVDSVSKKFNNCGARIGALITKDSKIINDMTKLYDNRISISNTEQWAIVNMFKYKNKIFKQNLNAYKERIKEIDSFLKRQNLIQYKRPDGAVFFLLTLPVKDTDILAEWILKNYRKDNQTVLILPTSEFYSNNTVKIRLSITNDSEYIIKALELLLDAIKQYKEEGLK